MKDLKLLNGDLVISGAGDLEIIENSEAVIQDLGFRLNTERGACPQDSSYGIDASLMFLSNESQAAETIKVAVEDCLQQNKRVSGIVSLQVNQDAQRRDTYSAVAAVNIIGSSDPYSLVANYPNRELISSLTEMVETADLVNQNLRVTYQVYDIVGVYLESDINYTGKNYAEGSYAIDNIIYLSTLLPESTQRAIVRYRTSQTPITGLQREEEIATALTEQTIQVLFNVYSLEAVWSGDNRTTNYFYDSAGHPGTFDINLVYLPRAIPLDEPITVVYRRIQ